jgi:chromate transport protein ChrA
MILKKIAGVSFVLAFLMAIVLFTGMGREYVSIRTAKYIFIIAGAVGLLLNLLSFQHGKHSSGFSFIYWAGSIVLFVGLTFLIMNWPYGFYIIVAGLIILGVSFFAPENLITEKEDRSDTLDSVD